MGRSNSSLELFFKREWKKVKMLIKIFWVNIFFNFSYASSEPDIWIMQARDGGTLVTSLTWEIGS